jgi:hypothetical protein
MRYFKHKINIPLGVEGDVSKIVEEFTEMIDTTNQNKSLFTIVEAADLITTVGAFTWKGYKVPFLFIVLFAYLRKPYKWVRDPILRWHFRTKKSDVFPAMTSVKLVVNKKVVYKWERV